MQTIANSIYADQFIKLEAIINAIQHSGQPAQQLLAAMADGVSNIQHEPERIQTQLFWNALSNRLLDTGEISNLYLVPDQGQQIKMFNLMAAKFPVVRQAHHIANQVFINQIAQDTGFAMLDIGLGTGQQMASLIQALIEQGSAVKQATIIGIEPSTESLAKATETFRALEAQHHIQINFTALPKSVEQLDGSDWQLIETQMKQVQGKRLINASFALHHVNPVAFRTTFFTQLKTLNPDAFVIIEPYADFTTPSLLERFHNAWHHYGLTFLAIDHIDASESEKSAIKQVFFGREMLDVLGSGARVEQFETAEMWLQHLTDAGFVPERIQHQPGDHFNALVQTEQHDHYFAFKVKDQPIASVIYVS